ncbi:MAG: hypothetical protein GTO49_11585, partial [Anaerolineae bacterium]|nr:hypothetical protein [Anaerolineae bacterium]
MEWLNFTSEITWMPWHLSDANLRTRAVTNGSDQRLDYLPVRVNFTTHTSTEADYNPSNCKAYQTANWTNCDDAFSSNDIYAYANGSAAVGILTSLESFTISLSTTATSNSASLTKGQVTANSVPFGTRRMVTSGGTADNYNSMMIDLYFSGSTIVVERFTADSKAIDSVVY